MAHSRWTRVEELFHQAVELPPAERREFLSQACGSDEELLREVESLLAADTPAEQKLVQAAVERAVEQFTESSGEVGQMIGKRLGHYAITRVIGEGGMGIVYEAHDERLDRCVALKTLRESSMDLPARRRLWREARFAAGIHHPCVCQLYDIGEEGGQIYVAMELLEGESLAERIQRGPVIVAEAIQIALGILTALEILHRKHLIHRDVKPSNIFLTPHGVKLLDFGLARPVHVDTSPGDARLPSSVTQAGMLVGTPHYMAPEQLTGGEPDERTDLFAVGAVLFEMLTGRRAFAGANTVEILHAVLYEQPPALSGSAAVSAVDLAVRRALSKKPGDRYPSAQSMSDDLRAALLREDTAAPAQARAITRLMVLPFRLLRPDAEIDFLGFSLADAITNSLSGLSSLVVRSCMAASKYVGPLPDLKLIAAEAEVDAVLTGTLLRSGDQLRASTQLVEAPGGAVIWTQTTQLSLRDIFQLQDELSQRVVESLAVPLTARESRLLKHDVPASATAYEFYLRANQLSTDWQHTQIARDLYIGCVERDPHYAPAWARLGRCYRLLGKYSGDEEDLARSEAAFRKALDLNPDLNLAHNLFAHLEADLGRAPDAMVRLLARTGASESDPNIFAGLVYACRFCGLLDASIAAHLHARRLDPLIPTSVAHAYFMNGNYQQAVESSAGDIGYIDALSQAALGREEEALELLRRREQGKIQHQLIRWYIVSLRALLERRYDESIAASERIFAHVRRGGEELYYPARQLAYIGETKRAIAELDRAIDLGFFCHPAMVRDPWLDSLRADPQFVEVLRKVQSRHQAAREMFVHASGPQILR